MLAIFFELKYIKIYFHNESRSIVNVTYQSMKSSCAKTIININIAKLYTSKQKS